MNDLLTLDDVAKSLDCAPETISAKLAAHELPGVKVGRSWRIPVQALIEHLNAEARRNVRSKPDKPPPVPAAVQKTATPERRCPPKLVERRDEE